MKQSLQPGAEYPISPVPLAEEVNLYRFGLEDIHWDRIMACPSAQLVMASQLGSQVNHTNPCLNSGNDTTEAALVCDSNHVPTYPSNVRQEDNEIDTSMSTTALLQTLQQQIMMLNSDILSVKHQLLSDRSPASVSSLCVSKALEGTKTWLRIVQGMLSITTPVEPHGAPKEAAVGVNCASADLGAMTMMILAGHQNLLSLFGAICGSIEQNLRTMTDRRDSHSSKILLQHEALPSAAQFTMVLQLLLHLVNRVDRVLLSTRDASDGGMEPLHEPHKRSSMGILSLTQSLIQTMPYAHASLQKTILALQARVEALDVV